MMVVRILYVVIIGILCFCNAKASNKFNVIIIMADDVGMGDISCYGSNMIQTPNIDKLASEGMMFENYYTAGAVCSPTRYSMITGQYPFRIKEFAEWTKVEYLLIDPEHVNIASLFKQNGYKTAAIGKWHLGYGYKEIMDCEGDLIPGPNELGFDYHWGVPMNHNDGIRGYVENDRLFGLDPNSTFKRSGSKGEEQVQGLLHERIDDHVNAVLTERVLNFIRINKDKSFFVYFTPTIAHTHITPHKRFRGMSEAGQYGDYVQELDFYVGKIMELLDKFNLSENTLLIFTSDNGGALGDFRNSGYGLNLADESCNVVAKAKSAKADARKMGHKTNLDLRGGKASPYEGGFRVPLIIRWSTKIKAGTTSSKLVNSTDYLATFADLLKLELPKNAGGDSFSFADVLNGEKVEKSRSNVVLYSKSARSFVDGNMKLIDFSYGSKSKDLYEVYNLALDPSEKHNLAEKEPETLKWLKNKLQQIVEQEQSR